MRPEFQRDVWSLGFCSAALAAVLLSNVLHKAGLPGRDVIGVAITFAIAIGLTVLIAEVLGRLGWPNARRSRPDSRDDSGTSSLKTQQQGQANDKRGAAERDHDD